MTALQVFADPAALGLALAAEIVVGLDEARAAGRHYVLGCPGGRSGQSTYAALATLVADADLSGLVIAMMDDYVLQASDGGWQHVPADTHYSCRRFAQVEIAERLDASARVGVRREHIWLPDPADPADYRMRLAAAGGVDLFIVASGASDGHVAFVKPGTPLDSDVAIILLADSTRRDNMSTFSGFDALEEVPTHGVSVGLGTIRSVSRRVRLVMHGASKQLTTARVLAADDFDPAWPATFIHRCPDPVILIDEAARPPAGSSLVTPGALAASP